MQASALYPKLVEVKSTYSPPWYLKVVKKICSVIVKIFHIMTFWKNNKEKKLSEQQIQKLDQIRNEEIHLFKNHYRALHKKHLEQIKIKKIEHPIKNWNCFQNSVTSLYKEKDFPPSLITLREFIAEFVENSLTCFFESKIQPWVSENNEVPQTLKTILIKLTPVFVHLADIIRKEINKGLANERFENEKKIMSETLHLCLHWLLQRSSKEETEKFINEKLELGILKELKEQNIQVDKNSIDLTIDWIKEHQGENYCTSLTTIDEQNSKETHQIAKTAISFLIEKKIELFNETIEAKVIKNLDQLIYSFLQTNGRIIADEVSGRLADILLELDFTEIVDELISLAYTHVKHYVALEEKERNRAKKENCDVEDFSSYLFENRKAIRQSFHTLEDAHQVIKDIYTLSDHKKAYEKKSINKFIRKSLDIILSQVTVEIDNKPKTIDWLEYVFYLKRFPIELCEIFDELTIFAKHSFSSHNKELLLFNKGEIVFTGFKKLLLAYIAYQIKNHSNKLAYTIYNELVPPDRLGYLCGEYILPAITEKAFESHIHNIFQHNIDTFLPLLEKYRDTDEQIRIKETLDKVLWEEVHKNIELFSFSDMEMSKKLFTEKYSRPLFTKICNGIDSNDFSDFSVKEIVDTLFYKKEGEEDPRYGELILDTVFTLGNFTGWFGESVTKLFKGRIEKIVSSSINGLTDNNYYLLDLIVMTLKEKYPDSESLNELYFEDLVPNDNNNEKLPPPSQLQNEILIISNLLHDIVIENSSFQASQYRLKWAASWTTKKLIGEDSTHIQNTIIKVFEKIILNKPMNMNFYFHVQDLILKKLLEGNEAHKNRVRQSIAKPVEVIVNNNNN